jgi:hypothetical protein
MKQAPKELHAIALKSQQRSSWKYRPGDPWPIFDNISKLQPHLAPIAL